MIRKSLPNWLNFISAAHYKDIDLGLDRIKTVADILNILHFNCPLITVAGTNGKGSCIALLEQTYLNAGYHVGAFSSPFLFYTNEQIHLNGKDINDEMLCNSFDKINQQRGSITLTAFEFITLAALDIFHQHTLDILLLEIGLGGRLDAVNIVDPDVAILSTIGIDHVDFLGDTREQIALEKAGIFRSGKPAICGDPHPPETLLTYVETHHVPLFQQSKDFHYHIQDSHWNWQFKTQSLNNLPLPQLPIQNASTTLMAISLLQDRLPVPKEIISQSIAETTLPGRFQIVEKPVMQIFDVAHNPEAAALLAENLKKQQGYSKTRAVFSMLHDKDIVGTITLLKSIIQEWYIAPLTTKRAASLTLLETALTESNIEDFRAYSDIKEAYETALSDSNPEDRIVIFGSFYTIAGVYPLS